MVRVISFSIDARNCVTSNKNLKKSAEVRKHVQSFHLLSIDIEGRRLFSPPSKTPDQFLHPGKRKFVKTGNIEKFWELFGNQPPHARILSPCHLASKWAIPSIGNTLRGGGLGHFGTF